MTAVSHARLNGRFIEIKIKHRKKKLNRTNQRTNFLGGSFSNRDYVKVSFQFRREIEFQHLTRQFFFEN